MQITLYYCALLPSPATMPLCLGDIPVLGIEGRKGSV